MTEYQRFAPSVQGVIAVDLQNAFLKGDDSFEGATDLVMRVEGLLERARQTGAVVAIVQNDGEAGQPDAVGTMGWELAVVPQPGDHVVHKTVDDAFIETDLERFLGSQDVRRVAVVGIFSEMCLSATARGAMVAGFDVVLPHDGHHASDVPAWEGVAPPVPEEHTRRVAEWSLGDGVDLVPSTQDVIFGPGGDRGNGPPSPGSERLED